MNPTKQYKSKRQEKLARKQLQSRLDKSSFATKTAFRDAERNFKSRCPPPDFTNVIDFYNTENCNEEIRREIVEVELSCDLGNENNLFFEKSQKAYLIKSIPGFIFIRNAFPPSTQKRIIECCLRDVAKYPNIGNLDVHYILPKDGLWSLHERIFKKELDPDDEECRVPLKAHADALDTLSSQYPASSNNDVSSDSESSLPISDISTTASASPQSTRKPSPLPSPILPPDKLVRKLRWMTVGYQYDWPTKIYHFDRRFPVPSIIAGLSNAVVKAIEGVGIPDGGFVNEYKASDWKAEAGLVNYYQLKDNLMAHVDKSEVNMDAPLVSFSFGHACIFLIGGSTKDTPPKAMYLRSGVPRILEGTLPFYLEKDGADPSWDVFADYMSQTRININIRQVFNINN
ncbi:10479_t:CDS:2 [Paraglomus occultum]|uniref:10479_t:CDS:1 n=1 Tax=Paraglomus occultum TaxID=144539 RepID=A0A9N9B7B9_9GLOM|nr:10479_t:CDS:2 [Paraglomus occultum]